MADEESRRLVKLYFEAGYSYGLILCFLAGLHEISISLRTLKRLLRQMGLRRRGVPTDIARAFQCIRVSMYIDPLTT